MKRLHFYFLGLFAVLGSSTLSSCEFNCVHGSGNMKTETRKVSDFDRIGIEGVYKVTLKQDSSFSVVVSADDNLLKYIHTSVSGGKLHIYNKRGFCNTGEITVTVGIKNLREVESSGVVELTSDGKITAKDVHFDFSGASKTNMQLNAANVNAEGSGSSELDLSGQASSFDIDLTGDSKVHAFGFVVSNCTIQSSGVGHSEVDVLNSLSVHSSGASEVKYKGNPTSLSNDNSGASSLMKVN